MSKYMTSVTAAELLNNWQNKKLVSPAETGQIQDFILTQQQEKELPLYLRLLIGVGAFISSLCFISFLSISELIDFDGKAELIIWGLVFIGLALFLVKMSGDRDNTVSHSFLLQSSFCAMGIGKILFVMGFSKLFHEEEAWGATFAIMLVTVAIYPFYKMSIDRFLSTLAIFNSLLVNILDDFADATEFTLNLFFFLQVLLAAFLLTHGKVKRDYIPLAYSTVVSLCITVIFFTAQSKFGSWGHEKVYSLVFINSLLTLFLIALIGWAAGSMEKLATEPLMLASCGAMLLAMISAPGVILSICLMVLGYAKHEKLLLLTGAFLMPLFIIFYYYNLDMTLMAKSGILIGSGVVLLLGRAYLAFRKLDSEGVV